MWANDLYEQKALGGIMADPSVFDEVKQKFHPELFCVKDYKDIASAILTIADNGKAISSIRVRMTLKKKGLDDAALQLNECLMSVTAVSETPELVDTLSTFWKKRTVQDTLHRAASRVASDLDADTDDVISQAQDALHALAENAAVEPEVRYVNDVLQDWLERQSLVQRGETQAAIPICLEAIETLIAGIVRKRTYVVAARPSMGKSALVMNVAWQMAKKGIRSHVFSIEQPNLDLLTRMVAAESSVVLDEFEGTMNDRDWADVQTAVSRIASLPIALTDKAAPRVSQIKAWARAEKRRHPDLSVVVVDHLGEVTLDLLRSQTYSTSYGEALKEIAALAKELDVAMIVVNQLNRNLESRENKRPEMSDLRESGRLEEIADGVIMLYRHGYYHRGFAGDPYGDGITEVWLKKNRQGKNAGACTFCHFDGRKMQFRVLEKAWTERYQQHFRGGE